MSSHNHPNPPPLPAPLCVSFCLLKSHNMDVELYLFPEGSSKTVHVLSLLNNTELNSPLKLLP